MKACGSPLCISTIVTQPPRGGGSSPTVQPIKRIKSSMTFAFHEAAVSGDRRTVDGVWVRQPGPYGLRSSSNSMAFQHPLTLIGFL